MTNESDLDSLEHSATSGRPRFGMVVLYVGDLQRSIEFYRLLGIDVSDAHPERPVAFYKEGDETRLILTTAPIAQRFDPEWVRPAPSGYQQVVEFFVDTDAAVDATWERLTAAGHTGITAPANLLGPYATVVKDPDGNAVLITNEPQQ
ncbi:VOC family protein [Rhodococcoides kyotonense]|uniref:Catechol 2,3-dioxygenase n=1 Tax=Rhodococcoides kyotonense TaxID=398843 RepID=A0A239MCM5_9NOCA|nr:VOC family protein [Rhodococcus kyotonensis]SNT40485.1 Catechol 2,3-dioxygenase [Rhodococcus kyotonensis]